MLLLLAAGSTAVILWRRHVAGEGAQASGMLRLFGNVDVRDAQLAFQDQGELASVAVEEGDEVAAGALLATLDTSRLADQIDAAKARVAAQESEVQRLDNGSRPQEIEAARAALAGAEARSANLKSQIARLESTAASGASSAQELDDARSALDVAEAARREKDAALQLAVEGPRAEDVARAKATLEALRADLALLQRHLADAELHAPSPGVVQSRLLEPGEIASPERPVLTLALTEPKWVRAFVPEPELGRVAPGMGAKVRSDSFGGRAYDGWVGFVSPVAEFTPKAVETQELRTKLVYEVRVYVRDPRGELRLGMPVTVDVDVAGGTGHAPAAEHGAGK